MEQTITYFEKSGADNTEQTLTIIKKRAQQLGIKTVVVASTRGGTAVKAVEMLPGLKIVAVSHSTGWKKPGEQEFSQENRKIFESKGGQLLTGTHLFAGVSRAVRKQYGTSELGDIVASTLKLMGQGFKVTCEIAVMAADAGLVRTDEDLIACAGSSAGADTAVVLTPVGSNDFFALKVKEILCKPRF